MKWWIVVLLLSVASFAQTDIQARGINKATTGRNEFGDTGKAFNAYWNCSRQWMQQSTPPDNNYCGRIYMEVLSGGVNSTGSKSQFGAFDTAIVKRTIGQVSGYHSEMGVYGTGDSNVFSGELTGYGGCLTIGDECAELLRGDVVQGAVQFSATVTGVSGTTISYGTASNDNTRGQNRAVIITTPAKVYSTGTVSSISGVPPVVTGSGTTWLTLGSGAVSNLFFELTACNGSGLNYIVPVRSIAADTSLTLDFKPIGADGTWPCTTSSGNYQIYKGGIASDVSTAGTIVVSPAGDFSVSDTIAEPLSYAYVMGAGVHGFSTYSLPPAYPGAGFSWWHNTAAYPLARGIYLIGYFTTGIDIGASGSVAGEGIKFSSTVAGGLVSSTDTSAANQIIARAFDAGSVYRTLLNYNRTNGTADLGNGFHASVTDSRISTNSLPVANTEFYLGYTGAGVTGMTIAPATAPNANVPQLDVQTNGGTSVLKVQGNPMYVVANASMSVGKSSNPTGTLDVLGTASNNTLLLTPTDSGPYVLASRDTSAVTRLGITNSGDIQKPATTLSDFVFENLATTKDVVLKTNGLEALRGKPSGIAQFANGAQVNTTATKPTCASGVRGLMWLTPGAAGVKDAFEVCAKDAADAYAWRTIY